MNHTSQSILLSSTVNSLPFSPLSSIGTLLNLQILLSSFHFSFGFVTFKDYPEQCSPDLLSLWDLLCILHVALSTSLPLFEPSGLVLSRLLLCQQLWIEESSWHLFSSSTARNITSPVKNCAHIVKITKKEACPSSSVGTMYFSFLPSIIYTHYIHIATSPTLWKPWWDPSYRLLLSMYSLQERQNT